LTAEGGEDWSYYNTTSNPYSGAPTNSNSGGTLIGNITPIGGGGVRGSSFESDLRFTFTDGTSPSSGTLDVSGIFNTQLDTNGAGVGIDLTLPTTDTYEVLFFASGFFDYDGGTRAQFTAQLTGASDYTDNSLESTTSSSPKDGIVYSLSVTPDNPNDVLSLSWVLQNQTAAGSEHILVDGLAISVVPEPSTYAVISGALALGLCLLRRRR